MKMQPTQGVSFPRSGYSATYHILRGYFGDAFVYCDADDTRHCGCQSVPCLNPKRMFAKNHDFGLLKSRFDLLKSRFGLRSDPGVPIIPTEHYFIQYRNPVWSITSSFKLYRDRNPNDNSRAGWKQFAFRRIDFWNRFVDKWVLDFPVDAEPPLYCTYEALITDPPARVREILAFFSDGPLNEERVDAAMKKQPIALRNRISEFEFYDPGFFRELEKVASHRLAELNLPSFDEGW